VDLGVGSPEGGLGWPDDGIERALPSFGPEEYLPGWRNLPELNRPADGIEHALPPLGPEQYLAARPGAPEPDPPIKPIDGDHDVVVQVGTGESTEGDPVSEDSYGDVPTEYPTAERGGPADWAAEDLVRRQEIPAVEAPDDPAFRQGHETESDEPAPSRRER